jgi:hypothetical protein
MGYQLLDRLIAGKPVPRDMLRVRPQGVVVRRSTDMATLDPPPVMLADPQVAHALHYTRKHYTNPLLRVMDVVAIITPSRGRLLAGERSVSAPAAVNRLSPALGSRRRCSADTVPDPDELCPELCSPQ